MSAPLKVRGQGRRVVVGVGGGIAAFKVASLVRLFTESGFEVTVVPTEAALHFVGEATWSALSGNPVTHQVWDAVEQVRHVRLGQEADLVVVAPATADLLARAAHGLADDLLTNVLLTAAGPVVMAPAMHTEMWEHPATVANVALLRERGVHVIEPAWGRLTGKDSGKGRMPEPDEIFAEARTRLESTTPGSADAGQPGPLAGRRVVVSAGGTREPIDPVRFVGNRSSGKQGYALAETAAQLGAEVTLVSANVYLPPPEGVRVVKVESALQMREAMFEECFEDVPGAGKETSGGPRPVGAPRTDVIVMAAAVADFRPADVAASKMKKTQDDSLPQEEQDAPVIRMVRNPDILADLVASRNSSQERRGAADKDAEKESRPLIVGFAAETGDEHGTVLDYARAKMERKGVDLLVANEVGVGVTFGQDTSTVFLLQPGLADPPAVGPADKREISHAIWTRVGELLLRP